VYKSLNNIFTKLDNKDILNYLQYHIGTQLNLEAGSEFYQWFNLVEEKTFLNNILSFCEQHNFIRIPSISFEPTENAGYYQLTFETSEYYLSFDSEDIKKMTVCNYFFKDKKTKQFYGDIFHFNNPPVELIANMNKFPKIDIEYQKDIPKNISLVLDLLSNAYKFLSAKEMYCFISNASYNANEIGEHDEDLEYSALIYKKEITLDDVEYAMSNDDWMKYYPLINRINEFKTFKEGWFDLKDDGDFFSAIFLDQIINNLCIILRQLQQKHNIDIGSNQVYIYPCTDGEVSIEMEIDSNSISLEYLSGKTGFSVFVHSVNFVTKHSTNQTFLIDDYDSISKFLYNIIKGE
jgi:hypothetical protein